MLRACFMWCRRGTLRKGRARVRVAIGINSRVRTNNLLYYIKEGERKESTDLRRGVE